MKMKRFRKRKKKRETENVLFESLLNKISNEISNNLRKKNISFKKKGLDFIVENEDMIEFLNIQSEALGKYADIMREIDNLELIEFKKTHNNNK